MSKDQPDDPRNSLSWARARVDEIVSTLAEESGLLEVRPPPPGQERRRADRYSLEEPARIELESWAELLELYTSDISQNGIFIRTSSPPQPGTEVGVHLLLPNGTGTIRFQGEVVRVVLPESGLVPGFGVQFHRITQEAHNTLQWILAQAKAAARTPTPAKRAAAEAEPIGPPELEVDLGLDLGAEPPPPRKPPPVRLGHLRAALCTMAARTDLAVLELPSSPSIEQIERAFARVGQQWRPSPDLAPEAAELTKAIYARIERAYKRLLAQAQARH
jgi:uncharacterized protein (TIGR02266 family)